MSHYAFDNIEDAIQKTRDIIFPFDAVTWAKFAVIILLTGYVAFPSMPSVPAPSTDAGTDFDAGTGVPEYSSLGPSFGASYADLGSMTGMATLTSADAAYVAVAVFVLGIIAFMMYVSSVFEFVMYKSVIEGEPKLGYVTDYLKEGLQYFLFRVVWIAVLVGLIGTVILSPWALLAVIPAILVLLVVDWVLFHFSLLNMIETGDNLVEAFSTTLSEVKEEAGQVALFWFVKWVIGLVLGIMAVMTVLFTALIVGIPFLILGFGAAALSWYLAAPVVAAYIFIMLALAALIAVPFRVYLYSYIVEVYRDIF